MSEVFANGRSVVHKGDGGSNTCPQPDVCLTRVGKDMVPVPYVNTAQDSDLAGGTTSVEIAGHPVATKSSSLAKSKGDEPGRGGGVISHVNRGKMTWITCSSDVVIEGEGTVRHQDVCLHNGTPANTGGQGQAGKDAHKPARAATTRDDALRAQQSGLTKDGKTATVAVSFAEISELYVHKGGTALVPEALVYQEVKLATPMHNYTCEHLRTFVRERAKLIDHKYVYVFASAVENPKPEQLELCHELKFTRGSFQEVALAGKESRRGHDHRAVCSAAPRRHTLELEVGPLDTPKRYYYFFLAPFQYPWKALEQLPATLTNRAARLFDAFWTDAKVAVHTPSALPLDDPTRLQVAQGRSLLKSCHVYLQDPLAQALLRAERAAHAMQVWQNETERLHANQTYALAKRVQGLIGEREELLAELVDNGEGLRRQIELDEEPLATASRRAQDAVLELIQWVGMEQRWRQREILRRGPVQDLVRDSLSPEAGDDPWAPSRSRVQLRGVSLSWRRPSTEPFCEFSQMVGDFSASDVVLPALLDKVLTVVHERLSEQTLGRHFLATVARAYTSGEKPLADAGASLLFLPTKQRLELPDELPECEGQVGEADVRAREEQEYKAFRKAAQLPPKTVLMLFEQYVPFWDYAYLEKRVGAWGIELEAIPTNRPRHERLDLARQYSKEARENARAAGIKGFLRPKKSCVVAVSAFFGHALLIGLDSWNLSRLVEQMVFDPKKATTKDYAALGNAIVSLSSTTLNTSKFVTGAKVFGTMAKPLALVGGVYDTVTSGLDTKDAFEESGGSYRTWGQGLKTFGSALSVVGGAASMTGVGVLPGAIAALFGVLFQAAGSYMIENYSDVGIFLRYCQWGCERGTAPFIAQQNGFGYHRNLRYLQDSLLEQHQAITCLCFPFKARFVVKYGKRFFFELQTKVGLYTWDAMLSPAWSLRAKVRVEDEGTTPREHMLKLDGFGEHDPDSEPSHLTHTFPILTDKTKLIGILEAVISYDPIGDERYRATRRLMDEWVGYSDYCTNPSATAR